MRNSKGGKWESSLNEVKTTFTILSVYKLFQCLTFGPVRTGGAIWTNNLTGLLKLEPQVLHRYFIL